MSWPVVLCLWAIVCVSLWLIGRRRGKERRHIVAVSILSFCVVLWLFTFLSEEGRDFGHDARAAFISGVSSASPAAIAWRWPGVSGLILLPVAGVFGLLVWAFEENVVVALIVAGIPLVVAVLLLTTAWGTRRTASKSAAKPPD